MTFAEVWQYVTSPQVWIREIEAKGRTVIVRSTSAQVTLRAKDGRVLSWKDDKGS